MTLVSPTAAFPLSDSTPFAQSAAVVDEKNRVLARNFLVKLSPTYAYAIFNQLSPTITDKAIEVTADPAHAYSLKLRSIPEERQDRTLLPVYLQAHYHPEERFADTHLHDVLAEEMLGRHNLDLKKNITADFLDEVPVHARDESGFLVSDKLLFTFDTFSKKQLLQQLTPRHDLSISRFSSSDLDELVDYDNSVSGFSRHSYVEELTRRSSCLIARDGGAIVGVIFGGKDRVFSLFADSRPIGDALLSNFLHSISSTTVSLFAPVDVWKGAVASRRVVRRHTRVVPSLIQWSRVYAHNVGMNIV